jgi:signal peptidase I
MTEPKEYKHRRRPWTAVMLSLILPGLGHVYCGKIEIGIIIAFIMTYFPYAWLIAIAKEGQIIPAITFFFFAIPLLGAVLIPIDAYRCARRTRPDYQLKEYNRASIYFILLLMACGGTIGYAMYVRDHFIEAFRIPSASMYPTIQYSDRLIANKTSYNKADPQKGDIIVFTSPENRQIQWIKRVVAVQGDTVEMKNNELYINDTKLDRQSLGPASVKTDGRIVKGQLFIEKNENAEYEIFIPDSDQNSENGITDFGPLTVAGRQCFVLGDNRNFSRDSRHAGPIPLATVQGKAAYLYFPAGDFSRFGTLK